MATNNANSVPVISSVPPFQTKEPERYRATRTVTIVEADGETIVSKHWLAKDGELRRHQFERAGNTEIYLMLPEGRFLLLSPANKMYAEVSPEDGVAPSTEANETESSPDRLRHTEPITASYQRLGTEMIGGRNTQKYRVFVNTSINDNVSVSETLMWVDEALHMLIKSESKSPDGTRFTMELTDIELDVDKRLFQVPDDYEKIAFPELRKRLRQSQP